MSEWPFDPFNPLTYDLVFADPPWAFKHRSSRGHAKSAQGQYQVMTLADIKALPVNHLMRGDGLLCLMATNPLLREGIDTLEAWGFEFKTAGHWSKKTKHGKQAFGTGYLIRCAGEPFLLGTVGRPVTTKSMRSVIEGVVREHSRKPDEIYQALELLMPGARRIELFGRQSRPNWDVWGDQANKFDDAPLMEAAE